MDRNSLLRVLVLATIALLGYQFLWPKHSKDEQSVAPTVSYVNGPGFSPDKVDGATEKPDDGAICKIEGNRFDATFASRGAGLVDFHLEGGKYEGMNLSTTPDHERYRSLRTLFRGPDGSDQMAFDRVVWKLDPTDGKRCVFHYEDATVALTKTIAAGERPFELEVTTEVKNLADQPKRHQLTMGTYAYHKASDLKGSLGRQSPWTTELSCANAKDVVRKNKDDFEKGIFVGSAVDRYAAVSSQYFAQALLPEQSASGLPHCEIFAENWAEVGTVFQAKLVYPGKELAPQATATYHTTAFFGPKERQVLAHAAGGDRLNDVINLGFFRPVARVLVGFLVLLHDKVTFGNWGLAIIVMTLCVRTLLFPLTWKSIKTTIAMRKLKPEVDSLNDKFKDDPQAKNLAMMELWKKHGVNPFGGCLPQLVQMPVWFAMYTTLQTAAEMYHTRFLWFKDLSEPDPFFLLPLLLGGFMILQQRLVPAQGMDPVQQKMMMWLMPVVFTVMMLFLPAALGVYMLTNSILGIVQQLVVEQVAPRSRTGEIVVKQA